MLPSLNHISMQKGLRYHLIPYRHTDDQRILQSGWTGGKPGYTLPRIVVLGVKDERLMIKQFCNLIGREAQLVTFNQKWWSQMQHFSGDYFHTKNLKD